MTSRRREKEFSQRLEKGISERRADHFILIFIQTNGLKSLALLRSHSLRIMPLKSGQKHQKEGQRRSRKRVINIPAQERSLRIQLPAQESLRSLSITQRSSLSRNALKLRNANILAIKIQHTSKEPAWMLQ